MDYYIYVEKQKVNVTEVVYKEFCRGERKEKYFKESDSHNQVYYYDALDDEDYNGEEMFADATDSVEALVMKKVLYEKLYQCILLLDENERLLIRCIYYNGESLRRIAQREQVPVTTLQYRHKKVLMKLKKLLQE